VKFLSACGNACRYDGLEIVEQREVGLPDSVHSMQLAGNFAYVGLRQVSSAAAMAGDLELVLRMEQGAH